MNQQPQLTQRHSITLVFDGKRLQVEKLGLRLPFARKPINLQSLEADEVCEIYVAKKVKLTSSEFDDLAAHLLQSREWLAGEGGYAGSGRICVEVQAPGRPTLFVDPSGSDYGRYVAKLD